MKKLLMYGGGTVVAVGVVLGAMQFDFVKTKAGQFGSFLRKQFPSRRWQR